MNALKAEFQNGHASWRHTEELLSERLRQCEGARDSLLQQLEKAEHKLQLQTAQAREGEDVELTSCRKEIHRLMAVVKNGNMELSVAEEELEKVKEEARRVEEEKRKCSVWLEEGRRRWSRERERVGVCEEEGRVLREEVGRLSEELRTSQRRLQEEMEQKAERERGREETLTHLQQELAKRAQQVRQTQLQ